MPRTPVHAVRIAADLRRRILAGELRPGAPLPGRRELAARYDVALVTLQRALVPLFDEGLLRTESTRGTYVAEHRTRSVAQVRVAIVAQAEYEPGHPAADAVWAVRAMRGCEAALSEAGISIRSYNVMHHARRWYATVGGALRAAAADGVDAIIGINLTEAEGWTGDLEDFATGWRSPLIYACGGSAPAGVTVVAHDQAASGAAAAAHCLRAGYRNLVAVRPYAAPWLDQRIAGARTAAGRRLRVLDSAGTTTFAEFGGLPAAERRRRWSAAIAAARAEGGPTALIAPNDSAAADLLAAMEKAGVEPGLVGLIGFDDQPAARNEGISSMAPPVEEAGVAAARSCLLALRGGDPGTVALPSRLIARASTFLPATAAAG